MKLKPQLKAEYKSKSIRHILLSTTGRVLGLTRVWDISNDQGPGQGYVQGQGQGQGQGRARARARARARVRVGS